MCGAWQGAFFVALLGVLASASYYDRDLDDTEFINELYKRIANMEAQEDYFSMPENEAYGGESRFGDDNLQLDARDSAQVAEIRDHEYLEHAGTKGGFQYISGGAGEGSQHLTPEGTQNNTQEVKSDESLPFYCHPPNPCPKGFTEADGCQTDVPDTAEAQKKWIDNMMTSGKCTCDEEHMFNCPKDLYKMNTAKGHEERDNLDKVLDNLLSGKSNDFQYGGSPYGGEKRESHVAKKGQIFYKPDAQDPAENPYLAGDKLSSVAKKGVWMK
jgi:hypothetical protein